jgi:hypothetical protein
VTPFSVPAVVNGSCTTLNFNEYKNGTGPGTDVLFWQSGTGHMSAEIRFDALWFLKEGAATSGVRPLHARGSSTTFRRRPTAHLRPGKNQGGAPDLVRA